jgi:hypothetical protein
VSQGELITAYEKGIISRRGFVRGLVSLGATMAFANHLADRVAAAPADQAAPRAAFRSDIYDDHNDRDRNDRDRNEPVVPDGPDIASAGNAGVATASAIGGVVSIGDINSGGNAGNAVGVGDTSGSVSVDGGSVSNSTEITITADGGTAIADASGGDGNVAGDE